MFNRNIKVEGEVNGVLLIQRLDWNWAKMCARDREKKNGEQNRQE